MADGAPTLAEFLSSDGYRWTYRHWRPASDPLVHAIVLHGIQSHGGWYEGTCRWLAERGCVVDFLDRRGSGLNEKERGDAPSFRRLLDDVGEFLNAQPRWPNAPRVLVGISWGGKLAAALPYRHPKLIDGIALLCPGLRPKVRPTFAERVGIVLCRLVRPRKLFPIPLNDPSLFTATPHWQEFIANDPLSLRQATSRFLVASTMLDIYLRRAGRRIDVPVLLLQAGQDRIVDPEETLILLQSWRLPDLTSEAIPGAHHTLEFEPEPDEHRMKLLAWLQRLAKSCRSGSA